MADLSRKKDRERLSQRREPYWQRLRQGAYLGFRSGPDTWIARFRGADKKQQYASLGEGLEFDAAKRLAEDWVRQLTGTVVRKAKRGTVTDALTAYAQDLRRHGRESAALEFEWRVRAVVEGDAFAKLQLEALKRDDFEEWRDRVRKGRAARTVNRYTRAVVAALNRAIDLGHVGNPAAWRVKALADDTEDNGTAIFLTPGQRKALISAASPNCAALMRGLELTGARPLELVSATAGDFDGASLRLAHRKGRPPKLRVRHVVLSTDGTAFFDKQASDKLAAAPLFTEDGSQPWRRHIWAREVRAAVAKVNAKAKGAARIPAGASAYSFRHARISELLQVHGVDPLTVAHQTGTSLAMIEKAYMRFIPQALREKLASVKETA